ncbi:hypothetical protein LDC_1564 [sediment metagenome]|uniref:Uncharacterized protein n=1 Tax=sediment metagenome TaxID=749907 RepID=D9PJ55_9ZZZZ
MDNAIVELKILSRKNLTDLENATFLTASSTYGPAMWPMKKPSVEGKSKAKINAVNFWIPIFSPTMLSGNSIAYNKTSATKTSPVYLNSFFGITLYRTTIAPVIKAVTKLAAIKVTPETPIMILTKVHTVISGYFNLASQYIDMLAKKLVIAKSLCIQRKAPPLLFFFSIEEALESALFLVS